MSAPGSAGRPRRRRREARTWRWVNALLGAGLALLVAGLHAARQQHDDSEYRSLQYRAQYPAGRIAGPARPSRP